MPIVSMKDMLIRARDLKYAVGQFTVKNLKHIKLILQVAKEEKSPVILGVSDHVAKYIGGFKATVQIVKELMEFYKVTVPVAIHLDQGTRLAECIHAIDAGFTSVMIDGSLYSLEENIKITKSVVEIAHAIGVSVEARLGQISNVGDNFSSWPESEWAIPTECEQLVRETSIDCLAPVLGCMNNTHNGQLNLRFKRMKEIMDLTRIPLAFYGAAGISLRDIQKAIFFGSAKIEVNIGDRNFVTNTESDCFIIHEKTNKSDSHKVYSGDDVIVKSIIKRKMQEFGSSGRDQLKYEVLYRQN
jgi:fructose-bisphosphate aldolase class II